MASPGKAITIFGSTGGSGLSTLRQCLKNPSNSINVLCRTPSKLLNLLSLKEAPSNLHIITGSIYDASVVKTSLLHPYTEGSSSTSEKRLPDIVVSAIGTVASFSSSKGGFKLNPIKGLDWRVCEEGIKVILESISELKAELPNQTAAGIRNDPMLVVVSTTGLVAAARDVPLSLVPMYYLLLATPHKDKQAMEDAVRAAENQRWVIVRPSLLTGDGLGEGKGLKNVRVGLERDGKIVGKKVVRGYSIQREDVGKWIFEECVAGEGCGEKWNRGAVNLTY